LLRLVRALHGAENLSKLIECPGVVRLHLERLLKVRDSCLAAAILRRQGASNIERLRVIGLHLNGPRRLFDGLRAVARAV